METLAEFQERNCRGYFYADEEKVGSGMARCTNPQPIKLEKGQCVSKRKNKEGSPTCPNGRLGKDGLWKTRARHLA